MTVYIEYVFLENFIIDYFLMLIGGKITYIVPVHPILAALFGALYACVCPLWNPSFIEKPLVLIAMCFICFGKNIKSVIYNFIAVSVSASCLFGIVNLFLGHMKTDFFYTDNVFFIVPLLSMFMSVVLYRLLVPLMQQKKLRDNTAMVEISQTKLRGIIDSGNMLYYKNLPVILVNKNKLNKDISLTPLIIPYNSLGGYGAVLGYNDKNVYVTYMDKTVSVDCVVALSENEFNKNFDVLLHPDIIKECV